MVQGDAQERACCGNMELRRVFVEIFERCQGLRHFLNFVKNQQGIFGLNIHAAFDFQAEQQAADVVIA